MEVSKMITLNKNTKKAQEFLCARERAQCRGSDSIYSIYDRPGSIKLNIARGIEDRLHSVFYHGGSSFSFTCSGYDKDNNLIVETKCNTYKIIG